MGGLWLSTFEKRMETVKIKSRWIPREMHEATFQFQNPVRLPIRIFIFISKK